MKIKFEEFVKSNEAGKFIVSNYWQEYLLCLFFQGYYSELWEELMDTRLNVSNMIQNCALNTIGKELEKGK